MSVNACQQMGTQPKHSPPRRPRNQSRRHSESHCSDSNPSEADSYIDENQLKLLRNDLAKTNAPVIDATQMSPMQLAEAFDNEKVRPVFTLALPNMLVRELKHRKRDNVNRVLSKKLLRDFKQLKDEKNTLKTEIEDLLKEEDFSFNLSGFLNTNDVSVDTLIRHGAVIFPQQMAKKTKASESQSKSEVGDSKNNTVLGASSNSKAPQERGGEAVIDLKKIRKEQETDLNKESLALKRKPKVVKNVFFGQNDISHIINNAPSLRNKLLTVTKQRKNLSLSFRQRMAMSPKRKPSPQQQQKMSARGSMKGSSPPRLDKEQMNVLLRKKSRTSSHFFPKPVQEQQKPPALRPPSLRPPLALSARQIGHTPAMKSQRSSRNIPTELNQEDAASTRTIFAKLLASRFEGRQPAQCLPSGETLGTDRQPALSQRSNLQQWPRSSLIPLHNRQSIKSLSSAKSHSYIVPPFAHTRGDSQAEGRTTVSRAFRVKVQDRQWRRTHYF